MLKDKMQIININPSLIVIVLRAPQRFSVVTLHKTTLRTLPTVPFLWEDPPQIQLLLLLFSAESGERSAVGESGGRR